MGVTTCKGRPRDKGWEERCNGGGRGTFGRNRLKEEMSVVADGGGNGYLVRDMEDVEATIAKANVHVDASKRE